MEGFASEMQRQQGFTKNPQAAGRTVAPEDALVKATCDYHPHIQAVFHLHNLYRDETLTLCTSCMLMWCRRTIDIADGWAPVSIEPMAVPNPPEVES